MRRGSRIGQTGEQRRMRRMRDLTVSAAFEKERQKRAERTCSDRVKHQRLGQADDVVIGPVARAQRRGYLRDVVPQPPGSAGIAYAVPKDTECRTLAALDNVEEGYLAEDGGGD